MQLVVSLPFNNLTLFHFFLWALIRWIAGTLYGCPNRICDQSQLQTLEDHLVVIFGFVIFTTLVGILFNGSCLVMVCQENFNGKGENNKFATSFCYLQLSVRETFLTSSPVKSNLFRRGIFSQILIRVGNLLFCAFKQPL